MNDTLNRRARLESIRNKRNLKYDESERAKLVEKYLDEVKEKSASHFPLASSYSLSEEDGESDE